MYGKKEGIKIVIKLPPKDAGGKEEKEVKTSKTRAEVYKSGGCCTKKKKEEKY